MAGDRKRRGGDPKDVPTGTGLLNRARNALAGRGRKIDSTVDEATGRNKRRPGPKKQGGLRR